MGGPVMGGPQMHPNNMAMMSMGPTMGMNNMGMAMDTKHMSTPMPMSYEQLSPYHGVQPNPLLKMNPSMQPMMYQQMGKIDRIPEFKPNKEAFSINNYMEEVRNKQRELNLIEIRQNIVELSLDQNGSRIIQQKIENGSPKEKGIIFEEMIQNVVPICNDVFGN